MSTDTELLRRYAEEHSEAAFSELVQRHVGFVYAAALRQLAGAVHRAEDVTQAVFIDLARKAAVISQRAEIVGWLYTSTHYAAAKLKRTEQRRAQREQEAHAMNEILSASGTMNWDRLRPVLDDAMHELGETDRTAILMRYFQGERFTDVARRLGLSEDAARMRVDRALDKLRVLLARRQITSTTAALGMILANQPAVAVPASLAASITGTALATASAGAGSATTFSLMNIKLLFATSVTALAIGVAAYEFHDARLNREAVGMLTRERDGFQAQLRGLEQRVATIGQQNAALQHEVQTARGTTSPATPKPVTTSVPKTALGLSASTPDGFFLLRSTADSEEARKQNRVRNGENLDANYAALYRKLDWTPAQREQFRNLMIDSEESGERLFKAAVTAARAENPNLDRAGTLDIWEATRVQMQTEQRAEVRQAFGDTTAQAVEHYQATLPLRIVANQLANALFNSDAPITPAQADQLVELMAQNAQGTAGKSDVAALNPQTLAAQAQSLLNPGQAAELQRIVTRVQEKTQVERERIPATVVTFKPGATAGK